MTQWRGMRDPTLPPPPPKNWGLTPVAKKLDYLGPALSRWDLRGRGWTDALIRKYLGDHDRRDSVDHWANFTGRDMYWTARVELAEAMEQFEADFLASAKRRKLTAETIARLRANRTPPTPDEPAAE